MGLSLALALAHAQRLAAESDRTDPHSLLRVLGVDFSTVTPVKQRRWLWMAAQTARVSYCGTLTPEALLAILTTGEVPTEFLAHVGHLLNEAPIQMVVMAVEQAALQSGTHREHQAASGRSDRLSYVSNVVDHLRLGHFLQILLSLPDPVGAGAFLTQGADFDWPISNPRNPTTGDRLRCTPVGQRIPAAWVRNAPAQTISSLVRMSGANAYKKLDRNVPANHSWL